ncbi:MAG: tRNA (guanosine(37)-N1)-methyltransferase TrmD [Elusimicrobia bacterium CG11_big_fil_rev_8_21_14_0_20_64_6]|nr:MAG: tRNA (guanosine(37)-N1)-methyltransferase TrmD [Elusimicrobia bacterium CG11_big_fil_rev_8_21_14_0_20_64_6]
MKIDFVTLFPGMFPSVMDASIVGRAVARRLVSWGCVNPRDFTEDKHHKVDDRPFGGGPGMLMMAEPLEKAIKSVKKKGSTVIFLSPQGKTFNDKTALRLSKEKHLVLVCGHYEGIDERAASLFDEEISVGDYVLTGGELPAMLVADAVARLVPGVLKKEDAAVSESFSTGLLDFPQYTRPRVWRGREVPEVLFSGDHAKIAEWRQNAARKATKRKRPDLIERA